MCFFKTSNKAAVMQQYQAAQEAAEARAREEKRQANLKSGSERINKAFDNFTPEYYSGVTDNVKTLGMADLNDQFKKARENLTFALARSGMLSSSVANQGATDLQAKNNEGAAKIELQGRDAVNKVKTGVEQERGSAISQLYATENPDLAANTANARSALILQDKPAYNPLGDIFSGVINGFTTLGQGIQRQNFLAGNTSPNTSLQTGAGGRVVGGV